MDQEQQTDRVEHRAVMADVTAEQEAEWVAAMNGDRSPREVAADWHGGQSSALYAYCSSGTVIAGFSAEVRDCIGLADNDDDRAELLALLEGVGGQWVSGTNTPGYLPDTEADAWDTFEEAKCALIGELLYDADFPGLSEDIAEELTNAAEAVNLWTDADRITSHFVTIGDRAYWIQTAE